MPKDQSSSAIAVIVAIIACTGTTLAAIISAPWLGDVLFAEPTLTFQQAVDTAVAATEVAQTYNPLAQEQLEQAEELPVPSVGAVHPTVSPIFTPTASPPLTQEPDNRLFWDDFEMGINPGWGMVGTGYAATNGNLVLSEGNVESQVVGNHSWSDYEVILTGVQVKTDPDTLEIQVRVQDRDNYLAFVCRGGTMFTEAHCKWYKSIGGQSQEIPGALFTINRYKPHDFYIEVQDNIYRTFMDGERVLYFVEDTYSSGGISLRLAGSVIVGDIGVLSLP